MRRTLLPILFALLFACGNLWAGGLFPSTADAAAPIAELDWANPIAVTDTVTLTIGRHHVVTVTSADKTLTLPAVSGNAGKLVSIEIAASTTKLITIDGNSSETIDGAESRIMWAKETAILLCNGTTWTKIAGKTIPMICTLYLNDTTQLFSADTNTKINLNSAMSGGCSAMANTGSNRIDIVRPGLYKVKTCVTFNNNNATAGMSRALGAINGSIAANGLWIAAYRVANYQSTPFNEMPMTLAAGDYVELYGAFSSGSFSTSSIYKNASPFTHLMVTENVTW